MIIILSKSFLKVLSWYCSDVVVVVVDYVALVDNVVVADVVETVVFVVVDDVDDDVVVFFDSHWCEFLPDPVFVWIYCCFWIDRVESKLF